MIPEKIQRRIDAARKAIEAKGTTMTYAAALNIIGDVQLGSAIVPDLTLENFLEFREAIRDLFPAPEIFNRLDTTYLTYLLPKYANDLPGFMSLYDKIVRDHPEDKKPAVEVILRNMILPQLQAAADKLNEEFNEENIKAFKSMMALARMGNVFEAAHDTLMLPGLAEGGIRIAELLNPNHENSFERLINRQYEDRLRVLLRGESPPKKEEFLQIIKSMEQADNKELTQLILNSPHQSVVIAYLNEAGQLQKFPALAALRKRGVEASGEFVDFTSKYDAKLDVQPKEMQIADLEQVFERTRGTGAPISIILPVRNQKQYALVVQAIEKALEADPLLVVHLDVPLTDKSLKKIDTLNTRNKALKAVLNTTENKTLDELLKACAKKGIKPEMIRDKLIEIHLLRYPNEPIHSLVKFFGEKSDLHGEIRVAIAALRKVDPFAAHQLAINMALWQSQHGNPKEAMALLEQIDLNADTPEKRQAIFVGIYEIVNDLLDRVGNNAGEDRGFAMDFSKVIHTLFPANQDAAEQERFFVLIHGMAEAKGLDVKELFGVENTELLTKYLDFIIREELITDQNQALVAKRFDDQRVEAQQHHSRVGTKRPETANEQAKVEAIIDVSTAYQQIEAGIKKQLAREMDPKFYVRRENLLNALNKLGRELMSNGAKISSPFDKLIDQQVLGNPLARHALAHELPKAQLLIYKDLFQQVGFYFQQKGERSSYRENNVIALIDRLLDDTKPPMTSNELAKWSIDKDSPSAFKTVFNYATDSMLRGSDAIKVARTQHRQIEDVLKNPAILAMAATPEGKRCLQEARNMISPPKQEAAVRPPPRPA